MKREARASSALNHPNITTVYEVIQVDDRVGIAMEFVPGASLRELGGHGTGSPVPDCLRFARQIAVALEVTHAVGIVHGDIKPENIVRPDGYVKVLDFGLAHEPEEGVGRKHLTGTLRYMAPEMLQDKIVVSGRRYLFRFSAL